MCKILHQTVTVHYTSHHPGEKPCECIKCGKAFSEKLHLIIHQKMYTGFCAGTVGKPLARNHLFLTERIYTREKSHGSSECGKLFSEKLALISIRRFVQRRNPMNSVNVEKPSATNLTSLHIRKINHGGKPYK